MSITLKTKKGKTYAVLSSTDGVVTTLNGDKITDIVADSQCYFVAPDIRVVVSEDSILMTECFNVAPIGLSAGGGASSQNSSLSVESLPSTQIVEGGIVYQLGELSEESVDLSSLAFSSSDGVVQTCELWLSTGAEDVPMLIFPEEAAWVEGSAPSLAVSTAYRITMREDDGLRLHLAYSYELETAEE